MSTATISSANFRSTTALRWPAALLIGLGLVAFANGIGGQFVLDDAQSLIDDPQMYQVWPSGPIRDVNRWFGVWTLQGSYWLGGRDPRPYHVANIAIHLAAGLTLFGLVRRTLQLPGTTPWIASAADSIALAAAAIWLVHPLQTQSVTYIVQRYESLMGLCFLLVLYCTLRGAQAARGWPWYVAAAIAAWLGAGTKEVMVAALPVLLLFDRCFLTGSWRDVLRRRWALHLAVALSAAWIVFADRTTFVAGGENHNAGFSYLGVSPWEYLRSQPAILLHYLRLTFWPDVLVLDHGWQVEQAAWRVYGLGAVIVMLLAGSLIALWRWPRLGFLGLSFFLILAPTSSIMPIADLAFEHRMYLPLAPIIVLVVLNAAWLLHRVPLSNRHRQLLGGVALVAVLGLLTARTIARNVDYCHPERLWTKNIAATPHHGRPYRLLALHLRQAGKTDEAKTALQQSLQLEPNDYKTWVEYGGLCFQERDYDRALELYRQAISVEPRCGPAYGNIGRIELIRGNYAAALAASQAATRADPHDTIFRKQVAWLLATVPDAALRDGAASLRLIDSIRQNPRQVDIQWHEVRAAALAECGRFDEAIVTANRAVRSAESIHSQRLTELKSQLAGYQAGRPWRLAAALPQVVQQETQR